MSDSKIIMPNRPTFQQPTFKTANIGGLKLQYIEEPELIAAAQPSSFISNGAMNLTELCNRFNRYEAIVNALVREVLTLRTKLDSITNVIDGEPELQA